MPEAILHTCGKPDNAGRPLDAYTYTWTAVKTGGHLMCRREAQISGRPCDTKSGRCREAGLCRRPCSNQLRTPTMGEVH